MSKNGFFVLKKMDFFQNFNSLCAPSAGPEPGVAGGGPLDETVTEGLLVQSGLSGVVVLDSVSKPSSSSLIDSVADTHWAKYRKKLLHKCDRSNKIARLRHKCHAKRGTNAEGLKGCFSFKYLVTLHK